MFRRTENIVGFKWTQLTHLNKGQWQKIFRYIMAILQSWHLVSMKGKWHEKKT